MAMAGHCQLLNYFRNHLQTVSNHSKWIDWLVQQSHESWYISARFWCSVHCCMKRRKRGFLGYRQVFILFNINESINLFLCFCFYVCVFILDVCCCKLLTEYLGRPRINSMISVKLLGRVKFGKILASFPVWSDLEQ